MPVIRAKQYRCPDCEIVAGPPTRHTDGSCDRAPVAYNQSKGVWECVECKTKISGDTKCRKCGRKVNEYVKEVKVEV